MSPGEIRHACVPNLIIWELEVEGFSVHNLGHANLMISMM